MFFGDAEAEYSKKRGYFQGILNNLEVMPRFYPGYSMRLYYDIDKNGKIFSELCEVACSNPIIDLCDMNNLPGTLFEEPMKIHPPNWRFFPTLDPQVIIKSGSTVESRTTLDSVTRFKTTSRDHYNQFKEIT